MSQSDTVSFRMPQNPDCGDLQYLYHPSFPHTHTGTATGVSCHPNCRMSRLQKSKTLSLNWELSYKYEAGILKGLETQKKFLGKCTCFPAMLGQFVLLSYSCASWGYQTPHFLLNPPHMPKHTCIHHQGFTYGWICQHPALCVLHELWLRQLLLKAYLSPYLLSIKLRILYQHSFIVLCI